MNPVLRIFAITCVFGAVSFGWMVLGGATSSRTNQQGNGLRDRVTELWGSPQSQSAPALSFHWMTPREIVRTEKDDKGKEKLIKETAWDPHDKGVMLGSTEVSVDLRLDQRRKGLMWYALYDVGFAGTWTYEHREPDPGTITITFAFPDRQAIYDDFRLVVDGENRAAALQPKDGIVSADVKVKPGQKTQIEIGYRSRGMDRWSYVPTGGVENLENFHLAMSTDFASIDFPPMSMSPSEKARAGHGWKLDWRFRQVLTGRSIGMLMPSRIQPGELAAALSFSAPISLGFFFLVLFVLGTLRGIDIHPINYLFLGGAFFAFHLLFAYSVDHLAVVPAFAIASATSLLLVVSYLRLVVGARFAFLEATGAQLVYLIGFSLAHFWEGYTGLTVTVLSVVTLFLLMQLTGRIKWSEVLKREARPGRPVEYVA